MQSLYIDPFPYISADSLRPSSLSLRCYSDISASYTAADIMDSQEKQWSLEALCYEHRRNRKTELLSRLSEGIVIPSPRPYRTDFSGYPAYLHQASLASEYSKEELLGAVKPT